MRPGVNADPPAGSGLDVADGVVLTTGDLLRPDATQIDSNQDTDFCGGFGPAGACGRNNYPGDDDIKQLYQAQASVADGAALIITFTSDATIAGLRFQMILASDEFLECSYFGI